MGTPAVVTPEAVPLDLQPAGLGSRFVALLIDWAVQAMLGFALLLVGIGLSFGEAGGIGIAFFFLLTFLVLFGYPIALETLWRGRTLGKAAMGLRVVTTEGGPVRFRHAAIRAALGLVDFFLTSGAAAVISVLATRNNQRLGDLVAGTLVLRERTGLPPPQAAEFSVPARVGVLRRQPRRERDDGRRLPGGAGLPPAGPGVGLQGALPTGPRPGRPPVGPDPAHAPGRRPPRLVVDLRGRRVPTTNGPRPQTPWSPSAPTTPPPAPPPARVPLPALEAPVPAPDTEPTSWRAPAPAGDVQPAAVGPEPERPPAEPEPQPEPEPERPVEGGGFAPLG